MPPGSSVLAGDRMHGEPPADRNPVRSTLRREDLLLCLARTLEQNCHWKRSALGPPNVWVQS